MSASMSAGLICSGLNWCWWWTRRSRCESMKPWMRDLRVWLALAFGAIVAGEAVWLRHEYRRARELAWRDRQQARQEEQLVVLDPAPTSENEQAMAADLVRLRHELATRRMEMWPEREGDEQE